MGWKRQKLNELTRFEGMSRKRLRESLNDKVAELRRTQVRRLENHQIHPTAEQPKPKKLKLQGDDAIIRLINAGRQHQDGQLGERPPRCDGGKS